MKLIDRIMGRMAATLVAVLSLWAVMFYVVLVDEIVDEVDDALELYSESIMTRFLAGETIPEQEIGTNNSYAIIPLPEAVARTRPPKTLTNEDIWIDTKNETEPARVLNMVFRDRDGHPYLLRVSTPTFDAQELQQAVLIGTIVLYLTLLLTVLLVNYAVIQRSMRPLYALLRWMDDYDLHHRNEPFEHPTQVTEFRRLNSAANRQVTRLAELYAKQRDFVDHAAHEMQTPLAVALNRLEELQQREDLSEGVLEEIAQVRRPLRRLLHLHRDMLQLSRIESGAYTQVPRSDVALGELIKGRIEDFSEIFAHKHIACTADGPADTTVFMHRALAEILFGNLLRNAWLYTEAGGSIAVAWSEAGVSVSNTGEQALDATRIFERFRHGSSHPNSNGLGLAMCRSVCQHYGFALTYHFENGRHCFEVTFRPAVEA